MIRCVWTDLLYKVLLLTTLGISNEVSQTSFGNVTGRIIIQQMEGNSTFQRKSGELASHTPTIMSFEFSDPRRIPPSATYTWVLGNGHIQWSQEPFVHCSYNVPGKYTFKLIIGANATKDSRTFGLFTLDLTVFDPITSVEFEGPLHYQVDQNVNWSFRVKGSPPAWLSWRVLSDCSSPSSALYSVVRLQKNDFNLNYTFTLVGSYCLDLRVSNDISDLQTSYDIYVEKNPVNQLVFILPSAAVIVATLVFISITVCRPQQKLMGENCLPFTDLDMCVQDAIISLKEKSEKNEDQLLIHETDISYNTQT